MGGKNGHGYYLDRVLILGVLLGGSLYGIYDMLEHKAIIFIVIASLMVIFMVSFINIKRKNDLVDYVQKLIEQIKKASDGNIELVADENEIKEVKELYREVEQLRLRLKQQSHLKDTVFKIVNSFAVNIELKAVLDEMLPKVIEGTGSNWGAIYMSNMSTGKLEIMNSLGFSKNVYKEFDITLGEGFLGQKLSSKEILILDELPEDTVYVSRTYIGTIKPKCMMVVPIFDEDEMVAILVLASIYSYTSEHTEIMEKIRYYLSRAIINGREYDRTQRHIKELEFQNQMIQNMNDTLEIKDKESKELLKVMLSNFREEGIVYTNESGTIETWNSGAEYLKGYASMEVVGKNVSLLFGEAEIRMGKLDKMLNIAKEQGTYNEEYFLVRKYGGGFWVDMTIIPVIKNKDERYGFLYILRDRSEVKELEEELTYEKKLNDKVLESSTRALLLTTSKGVVKYSNITAESILRQYNEKIQGKNISEFFEDAEEFRRDIYEVVKQTGRGEFIKKLALSGDDEEKIKVTITRLEEESKKIKEGFASVMIRLQRI